MLRYNHRILERKWRTVYKQKKSSLNNPKSACTYLIPEVQMDLENARLLVLTDFFAASLWGENYRISAENSNSSWLLGMEQLGVFASVPAEQDIAFDLAVCSRDFSYLQQISGGDILFCGRLLRGMEVEQLVPDFGGDALRIYFMFSGPPERDYVFDWHGLVSSYRFVEKVWKLGKECSGDQPVDPLEMERLANLATLVRARVLRKKPHTALAAIMGYLKAKRSLNSWQVNALTSILRPFTPFLSAELAGFVTTVKDNNGGKCDQTDC